MLRRNPETTWETTMADYTVKRIDDMDGAYGGAFKRVRAELGVTSFGMAIIDLPPSFDRYPTHDHAGDGQEEVFMALRGSGELVIDRSERVPLDADHVVRVAAGTDRKVVSGPDGLRVLVLGATPGAVYDPPELSKLGSPDPALQT
jgi:mannose-6-phosphate isomerase-like protein (cupin superfamily)